MATAAVHVGNVGTPQRREIIHDFYQRCGRETIGPAQVKTGEIQNFTTLEELVDHLLEGDEFIQIVVNHGNPEHGLLIPFTRESPYNATGGVIAQMASLAVEYQRGCPVKDPPGVVDLASKMGVRPAVAVRLLEKLGALIYKEMILEIRGCNIGKSQYLLRAYKKVFSAKAFTAPKCRMFYLRIVPHRPPHGVSMAALTARRPALPGSRRRSFSASGNPFGSLIIDVRDIDGHSRVDSEAFMDDPHQAFNWGAKLDGEWRIAPQGTGNNRFVLPVLWDNDESSWHTPLEETYRQKLVMV